MPVEITIRRIVRIQPLIRSLARDDSNLIPLALLDRSSVAISAPQDGGSSRFPVKAGRFSSNTGCGTSPLLEEHLVFDHLSRPPMGCCLMPQADQEISSGTMWKCEPSGKSMTTGILMQGIYWFKGSYFDRLPASAGLPPGGNVDSDYFYFETTFRI